MFETDSKGAYVSNFLSSNMSIINSITQFISSEQLNNLKHLLLIHLPSIIGEYKGAFGIDMMVYKELNEYLLNPCIEINFRRTMGRAARDFYDYYCVGKEGVFNVSYSNRNLKHEIKTIAADNPEILIDGKLEKGFKSLTKIEEDSRFCIYSIIY